MSPSKLAPGRAPARPAGAKGPVRKPPTSAGQKRQRGRGPAIDPRIRARRDEVARSRSRRRLIVLGCVLGAGALVAGGLLLLHSPVFGARAIKVTGSVHTPPSRIIAVAGLASHPPLIDVDPGRTAARVERLPWVKRATVSRHWPDGLSIVVTERTPVAAVAAAGKTGRWLVVDGAGRVVETVTSPPAALIQLTLPSPPTSRAAWLGRDAGPALRVASSLPRAFSAQVTQVTGALDGTVTLALGVPVRVSLGSPVDLSKKYEDVAAILAGAPLQAGNVIDVTVPDAPTVGPG